MGTIPIYNIEQFHLQRADNTFYASTVSTHLHEQKHIKTPHKHNFYSTLFITQGSGTHDIDLNSYTVKPGYVFTMHPGQVHSWKLSTDIEGYTIFHTKEFFDRNFTYERMELFSFFGMGSLPLIILNSTEIKKVEILFQYIVEEYELERPMRLQKICSLVNVLYIDLSLAYPPQAQQANHNYQVHIRQLESLIDKNFKSLKSPIAYASLMNISPKHLNRIAKINRNKTTSEIISDRVMLEAKRMLIHSSLSVTQIALELGYEDNSYFFRLFKNKNNETPIEFIKNFRKN